MEANCLFVCVALQYSTPVVHSTVLFHSSEFMHLSKSVCETQILLPIIHACTGIILVTMVQEPRDVEIICGATKVAVFLASTRED